MIFKIKFSRRQIAGMVLATMLLSLNFMMRYGVWKRMQYYNLEKTRYEELDLAYQLKGWAGIDFELKNMLKLNPSAKEFVETTEKQLRAAKDPGLILKEANARDQDQINRLRSNRFIISNAVYVVVALQVLLSGFVWYNDRRRRQSQQTTGNSHS